MEELTEAVDILKGSQDWSLTNSAVNGRMRNGCAIGNGEEVGRPLCLFLRTRAVAPQ